MSEEQTPVETPVEVTDTVEQPVNQPLDILSDDGKFNEAWRNSLPDDIGKHSIFEKYDNPVDLIKGSINAQSHIGKKAEEFWQSEDPNDIQLRNQIMGKPNSYEEYDIKLRDEAIQNDKDQEIFNNFKESMFNAGLTNDQVQAVVDYHNDRYDYIQSQNEKAYDIEVQDAESKLREVWQGDEYEYNMSKVMDTLEYMGLSDLADDPAYGNNVHFIQSILEKITPLISDDEIIKGNMGQSYSTISDELDILEQDMREYDGNTSDAAYQNMIKHRAALLEKIS